MNKFPQAGSSKLEKGKPRFYVKWNDHARHLSTNLCSQIENQIFTDLALSCGSKSLHVHKCILAASSTYFMVSAKLVARMLNYVQTQ